MLLVQLREMKCDVHGPEQQGRCPRNRVHQVVCLTEAVLLLHIVFARINTIPHCLALHLSFFLILRLFVSTEKPCSMLGVNPI